MCTELKGVARDMYSTCSICKGQDAYSTSDQRPIKLIKSLKAVTGEQSESRETQKQKTLDILQTEIDKTRNGEYDEKFREERIREAYQEYKEEYLEVTAREGWRIAYKAGFKSRDEEVERIKNQLFPDAEKWGLISKSLVRADGGETYRKLLEECKLVPLSDKTTMAEEYQKALDKIHKDLECCGNCGVDNGHKCVGCTKNNDSYSGVRVNNWKQS
jgi:hypothetical protein